MASAPALFLKDPPLASITTSDVPEPTICPPSAMVTSPPPEFLMLMGVVSPVTLPEIVVPFAVSMLTPCFDVTLPIFLISFAPVRFTLFAVTSRTGTLFMTPVEVTSPFVLISRPSVSVSGISTLPTLVLPALSPPARIFLNFAPSVFFKRPFGPKTSLPSTRPDGAPPAPGVPKEMLWFGV